MKTFNKIPLDVENFSRNAGKIAGYLFLFNLLVPTLSYVLIQSKLFTENDPIQTASQILTHELVFRWSLLLEMFLSFGLILLGYILYIILKNVHPLLPKIALYFKITEAILMSVITLIAFLALQLLTGNYQTGIDLSSAAGILFLQHGKLNSIPMLFLGIEMVIFNDLFFKSRIIPTWISLGGILAFILIFAFALLSILAPQQSHVILTLPSFIYELIIGFWLIIKGIKIP